MIELIVGLFIGTFCGVTVMVLCNIAADSDREMEEIRKGRFKE